MVVTAPFTQRFTLTSPAAHANALMPLLHVGRDLEYQVCFHRPSVSESDFAWDDFQDQVVIQTRLCKLVVRLEAVKTESKTPSNGDRFFPRQLPEVKASSFKLFDHIERTQQLDSSPCAAASGERRALVVSESFHGDKKKSDALAPLDPGLRALPPISSSRPGSGSSSCPMEVATAKPSAVSTDVNNDREAKAVILKMRARNRHQTIANSAVGAETIVLPFPESVRLDSSAQAELEHFHHLVCSAMEGVGRDAASGKNELEYYKQFLPKPSSSDALPVAVAAAAVVPVKPALSQPEPCSAATSISASRRPPVSQPARASKPPAKLPTLMPPNELPSIAESNQETSPAKVSNVRIRAKKLGSIIPNSKPQTLMKTMKAPLVASKPCKPQPLPNNSKHKPRPGPKNGATKADLSKPRKAAEEPEHGGLSDFDDSDPEVDAAPLLPDDLMMAREDDGGDMADVY